MSKTARQQTGHMAETLACKHLQQHGLTLIERNFHCRQGEIDLIMRDGDYTVFVEVRYRRNQRFSSAAESVNQRKQQKIISAAAFFLQQHKELAHYPARFDVIAMGPPENNSIDWIQDAFQVT